MTERLKASEQRLETVKLKIDRKKHDLLLQSKVRDLEQRLCGTTQDLRSTRAETDQLKTTMGDLLESNRTWEERYKALQEKSAAELVQKEQSWERTWKQLQEEVKEQREKQKEEQVTKTKPRVSKGIEKETKGGGGGGANGLLDPVVQEPTVKEEVEVSLLYPPALIFVSLDLLSPPLQTSSIPANPSNCPLPSPSHIFT